LSAARIFLSGILPERLKKPSIEILRKFRTVRRLVLKDTYYPVFRVFVVAGINLEETTLVIRLRAFELGKKFLFRVISPVSVFVFRFGVSWYSNVQFSEHFHKISDNVKTTEIFIELQKRCFLQGMLF